MNGGSPRPAEPAVDAVLVAIREAIVAVTGSSLVGLYLSGSLASGDFDAAVSDLDVLAVLADRPSGRLVPRLRRMRAGLARANPAWDDRIEVIYISTHGLATCRTTPPPSRSSARVSPSTCSRPDATGSSTGIPPVSMGCGCLGRRSTR
jgi:hypothetical protein